MWSPQGVPGQELDWVLAAGPGAPSLPGGEGERAASPEGEASRLAMPPSQDRESAQSRHWHSAEQVTRKTTWRQWHLCWVSGTWGDFSRGTGCWREGPPQRCEGAGAGVGSGRAQGTGPRWAQVWWV